MPGPTYTLGLLDHIARFDHLTQELAKAYALRGDTIAEKIKSVNSAWSHLTGLGVTERRESSRAAGAQFDAVLAKDEGEIQAMEIERDYVKTMIELWKAGLMP